MSGKHKDNFLSAGILLTVDNLTCIACMYTLWQKIDEQEIANLKRINEWLIALT